MMATLRRSGLAITADQCTSGPTALYNDQIAERGGRMARRDDRAIPGVFAGGAARRRDAPRATWSVISVDGPLAVTPARSCGRACDFAPAVRAQPFGACAPALQPPRAAVRPRLRAHVGEPQEPVFAHDISGR